MSLRLGGDGAITGCTSLAEPALTLSGLTVSGQIFTVSGTTAAPGVTFVDDSDTGIYSPAANQVAITTSATERLKVDDTGKVGIGTNSPATILHTYGSYPTVKVENNSTAQYASASIDLQGPAGVERITKILHGNSNTGGTETYFKIEQYDSNGAFVKTLSNYDYQFDFWSFNTAGTERIRIDSTGGVGIGTSTIDAKLKIQASNSDNPASSFAIRQNNAADTAQTTFSIEASPNDGVSRLLSSATNTPQLAFYTGGSERLRIQTGGGISFNGDTATANALDDYEEGTWTPSITSGITSPSLTTANGLYTKIGRVLIFNFDIRVNSGTPNSNTLVIGGLPYTSANVPQNFGSVTINYNNLLTGFTELRAGHISTGSTSIQFFNGTGTINGNSSGVNWINGRRLIGYGFLMTA